MRHECRYVYVKVRLKAEYKPYYQMQPSPTVKEAKTEGVIHSFSGFLLNDTVDFNLPRWKLLNIHLIWEFKSNRIPHSVGHLPETSPLTYRYEMPKWPPPLHRYEYKAPTQFLCNSFYTRSSTSTRLSDKIKYINPFIISVYNL